MLRMIINLEEQLAKATTAEQVATACTVWLQQIEEERQNVAGLRVAAVERMRADGLTIRQIANKLSLSRWVVQSLLRGMRSIACTPPQTP
jgi:hypothetical protein